jgi:anti-anti-sigma regulatory factor
VILDILANRTPELADVLRLCKSLEHPLTAPCIVVNLSQVRLVPSRLLASLVSLQQEVLEINGRLVLCGLPSAVRKALGNMQLDQLFDIFDTEADALRGLRSVAE